MVCLRLVLCVVAIVCCAAGVECCAACCVSCFVLSSYASAPTYSVLHYGIVFLLYCDELAVSALSANHVLEQALQPGPNSSIPQAFFKSCVGVVLLSVVEVGFVISGNLGTGILLKKLDDIGSKWSAPVACGLTGVGYGLLVGGSIKDIMMFIFDEATLQKIGFDKMGLKLGAQVRLNLLTICYCTRVYC